MIAYVVLPGGVSQGEFPVSRFLVPQGDVTAVGRFHVEQKGCGWRYPVSLSGSITSGAVVTDLECVPRHSVLDQYSGEGQDEARGAR